MKRWILLNITDASTNKEKVKTEEKGTCDVIRIVKETPPYQLVYFTCLSSFFTWHFFFSFGSSFFLAHLPFFGLFISVLRSHLPHLISSFNSDIPYLSLSFRYPSQICSYSSFSISFSHQDFSTLIVAVSFFRFLVL